MNLSIVQTGENSAENPISSSDGIGGIVNILIVDDEPKNLTVLETVLDSPRYRVIRAESADKALLALLRQEQGRQLSPHRPGRISCHQER